MFKKKNIKWLIILVMVLLVINQKNKQGGTKALNVDHASGYTICDYINGITFDMPDNFLLNAQTITVMSGDMDQYLTGVWLVKSNNSDYLFFQNRSIVVIAKRGTTFLDNNQGNTVWDSLESSSLNGTWFSAEEKKFKRTGKNNGAEKVLMGTVGDVSITSDLYGTYVGRLAILHDGEEEWSIFAGCYGEKYADLSKNQKDILCQITSSLSYVGISKVPDELVDIPVVEPEKDAPDLEPIEDMTEPETEDPVDMTRDNSEETLVDIEVIPEEEELMVPDDTGEEIVPAEPEPEEPSAQTVWTNPLMTAAISSSIEELLIISEVGKMAVMGTEAQVDTYVRLDAVYTGNVAATLLEQFLGEVPECPKAQKWHVAEFTAGIPTEAGYIESYMVGLDGKILKYNGVENDNLTHDIHNRVYRSENGYEKYYIYYSIPNGCEEYVLKFGCSSYDVFAYYQVGGDR